MRSVSMPVLLVRPHQQPPDIAREPAIRHILVPLDGSPLAEQILAHAIDLGRLTQAEYTLLQAVEPMFVGYGPEMYTVAAEDQVLEALRAQAQAHLDRLAARLRAEGLKVQAVSVIDFAAAVVLDYAREHAVDLIALDRGRCSRQGHPRRQRAGAAAPSARRRGVGAVGLIHTGGNPFLVLTIDDGR